MHLGCLDRAALALALSLSACHPAPPPVTAPLPPAAPARPLVVAVGEPSVVLPVAHIPRLVPLISPVCNVPAPDWSGELRLRSGGVPYGHINGGSAMIALGGAAHNGVSLATVGSSALRVLGVVDPPTIYLAKPTLLSKVVVPRAPTPVSWHETTKPDHVIVALDVSDLFAAPTVAEAVVTCDALTGSQATFDARAFVAPAAERTEVLAAGSTLIAGLGERSGARLGSDSRWGVEIVGKRGDMTRVVIDMQRYLAVGWVATADLHQSRVSRVPRVRMGAANQLGGRGDTRCAHDLPLIASVAGEWGVIGTLSAGTPFNHTTLDVEPGFESLELFEEWFYPAAEAKLLVRAEDLCGC